MVVKVQNKDQPTGKNMKKTTKEYSGKNRNLGISADHSSQNSRMLLEHARYFTGKLKELSE